MLSRHPSSLLDSPPSTEGQHHAPVHHKADFIEETWFAWLNLQFAAKERWRLALIGGVLGILVGATLFLTSTRVFIARGSFIVEQSPFLFESQEKIELFNAKEPLVNFISSVRTREMVRAIADQLGVPPRNLSMAGVERKVRLNKNDEANITISTVPGSRICRIEVESPSSAFSTRVARALIEELELLNRMAGSLNIIDAETKLARDKMEQLNLTLTQATANRIRSEQDVKVLEDHVAEGGALESAPPFANDSALLEMLRKQTELRTSLEAHQSVSIRGDTLATLRTAVRSINARIREYALELAQRLRSTYTSAKAQEEALQRHLNEAQETLNRLNNQRATLARSIGDAQLRRQAEPLSKLGEVKEASVVLVIDYPEEPSGPARPSRLLFAVLSVALAGVFGVGSAVAVHFYDRRVTTPQQLAFRSGIATQAVLPEALLVPPVLPVEAGTEEVEAPGLELLADWMRRNHPAGVTPVYLLNEIGRRGRCAAWSARLALLLARCNVRTLVLDLEAARFRSLIKPLVPAWFAWEQQPHLEDWFRGHDPLDSFIQPTGIPNLGVIRSRGETLTRGVVGRRSIAAALVDLARDWDLVLVLGNSGVHHLQTFSLLPKGCICLGMARYRACSLDDVNTFRINTAEYGLHFGGIALYDYPESRRSGWLSSFALDSHDYALLHSIDRSET